MPTRRFASVCLTLAVAGLAFTGCEASVSTGDSLNTDKLESTIKNQYPDQADGLTLTAISCEGGDAKVGTEFTCTATNSNDIALDIDGKVNKVKDDNVGFHWEVSKAVAPGAVFADVATTTLQETRAVDTIDCPDDILVEKGTVVDCVGTMDDGSERKVKLTLTDGNGAFDIDLLGPVDS